MPPILATIDVEDLGSAKVREFRDALTDLLSVQQEVGQSSSNMATNLTSGVTALGSVASASRAAADGLAQLSGGASEVSGAVTAGNTALKALSEAAAVVGTAATTAEAGLSGMAAGAAGAAAPLGALNVALATVAQQTATAAGGLAEAAAATQAFNTTVGAFSAYGRAYADTVGVGARATQEFKDALSNLAGSVQDIQQITEADRKAFAELNEQIKAGAEITPAQSAEITRLAGVLQNLQGPLTAVASEAADTAQGLSQMGVSAGSMVSPLTGSTAAIEGLAGEVAQVKQNLMEGADQIRIYAGGLAALSQAAVNGGVPIESMAKAAAELAQAARDGVPGLSQNAAALETITKQLEAGVPLTQEQADALVGMARELGEANREALGLGTAMEELVAHQRESVAAIQESYTVLKALSDQLRIGTTVTKLQADALQELAQRAKEGNGFTAEEAAQVQRLADAMKAGTIVTKAQADAVQQVTQRYAEANKETLGLRDATNENTSAFEKYKLAAAAVSAVLLELGSAALNYATSAAQGAARGEVLGTVMLQISKNAHLNSVEMQAQVERIRALGITADQATNAVIKFAQAQLKVTDAAKLARVAQDLAVVAGTNSSEAFDRLTHSIESQSVIMLRQFGIVTGLHTIMNEYAASVGKTAKQLDDNEKKQAFLNKVLEEGAKFAGTYEAAMGNVGKQFTSLARLSSDVQDAIGNALIPVFGVYVKVLTETYDFFLKLPPSIQAATAALLAFAGALATIGGVLSAGKLLGVGTLLAEIPGQATAAVEAFTKVRTAAVAVGEGVAGIEALGVVSGEAAVSGGLLSAVWAGMVAFFGGPIVAAIVAVTVVLSALTAAFVLLKVKGLESLDNLRVAFADVKKATDPLNEAAKSVAKLREEVEKNVNTHGDTLLGQLQKDRVDQYNKGLESLQSKLGDVSVQFDKTSGTAKVLSDRLSEMNRDALAENARLVDLTKTALEAAQQAYDDQSAVVKGLRTELKILADAHGDVNKAIEATRAALDKNKDAISGQTSVWHDLWTILKNSFIITWNDIKKGFTETAALISGVLNDAFRGLKVAIEFVVPQAAAVLDYITKIINVIKGFNPADWLHRIAQVSTVQADAGSGATAAVTERLNAETKALLAAKVERDKAQRLLDETDPTRTAKTAASELAKAQQAARAELFGGLTPTEVNKKRAEIVAAAGKLWTELESGVRTFNEKGQKIKPELLKAEDVSKLLDTINKKLEAATAVAAKEGEKYQKALEQFLGTDPELNRRLKALNAALAQTKDNHDAYLAVIQRGSKDIEKFNLLTDAQKAKLGGLGEVATASAILIGKAADAIATQWEKANREGLAAFSETGRQQVLKMTDDLTKQQIANAAKVRDETIKANDSIRKDALALQDELAEQSLRGVDLQVYQLNRKMQEIRKAADDEKRVRQLAVDDERRVTEEKIRLNHQELADYANTLIRKRELELQSYVDRVEDAKKNGTIKQQIEAQQALDGAKAGLDAFRKQIFDEQVLRDQQLQAVDAGLKKEVDDHQAAVTAMNGQREKMTQAQIAQIKHMVDEVSGQWSRYRQVALNAMQGVVDGVLSGFEKLVSGASIRLNLLTDVWESVKRSMLSIMADLLKQWVASWGIFQTTAQNGVQGVMGAVNGQGGQGQGGAGGLLQQLLKNQFGRGGASGGVAGGAGSGGIDDIWGAGAGAAGPAAGTHVPAGGVFGGTTLGGVLGAGGAGLLGASITDALLKKWIDGSSAKGAASGAAGGFAAGAAAGSVLPGIGTLAGGLVGAGVGAIKGWLDARKMREEMKANREEIIQNLGGLEAFKKKADEAGFAYEKFLNTKKPSDFGEETVKLKAALDALDLKKAKEALPQIFSQFQDLRKQAQLVGYDIGKIYNAKSVADMNAEQEKLNKLLEEQKLRLGGLATAAQGLATRLQGEFQRIQKDFKSIFPNDDDFADFQKKFQEARVGGFVGTAVDFAKEFHIDLTVEQLAKLQALVDNTQKSFNGMATVATATFAGILAETGDIVQAFAAIGPALDALQAMIDTVGVSAQETGIANLLLLRRLTEENADVVNNLTGITQMVRGLADANRLTQDTFNVLGADANAQFQTLIDRGVSVQNALILMQPTLQALYDAEKSFGLSVDDATQKLIDQGVEAGIVGDQFQTVQQKTLDILVIIAKTLGADLPAAYDTVAKAAENSGTRQRGALDGVGTAAEDARTRAAGLEDAYTKVGTAVEKAAGAATDRMPEVVAAIDAQSGAVQVLYDKYGDVISGIGGMVDVATRGHGGVLGPIKTQQGYVEGLEAAYTKVTSQINLMASTTGERTPEQAKALHDLEAQANEYQKALEGAGGAANGMADIVARRSPDVLTQLRIQRDEVYKYRDDWVRGSQVITDALGNVIRTIPGVGGALDGVSGRLKAVQRGFEEASRAAEDFGARAEDAATGAAEGHSPTGLKQVVNRIREAQGLYRDFARDFVGQSAAIEAAAARTGVSAPGRGGDGVTNMTVQVTASHSVIVNGTKATAREQWEELKPHAESDMENNANQYAAKIASAAMKYQKRRG